MDLDDFRWLLGPDGQDLLFRSQAMVESGVPPLKAGERLRASYDASRVAAALSQVDLRTRAVAKFGDLAALMYFTRDGLEQATRLPVADHRAGRMSAASPASLVDLGCGIGGDLIAFCRAGITTAGVDLDPLRVAVAQANLGALGLGGAVKEADATTLDTTAFAAVFADPARRTGAGRTFDVDAWTPPWTFVEQVLRGDACVKVAPGIPHALVPPGVEAEWVSDHGEVKEAALWSGRLATTARRATVLGDGGLATLTDEDDPGAEVRRVGQYLYEPDGAVIRAGLVTALAAGVEGGLVDERIAYVTSDRSFRTPFGRGYEVVEELPVPREAAQGGPARARDRPAHDQEARRRRRARRAAQAARPAGRERGARSCSPACRTRRQHCWCVRSDGGAGSRAAGQPADDPRRWVALVVCCSALFMTLLDVSVTNVALPSIGSATGAGPSELQWVVSGYTLAFGLVPVLAGRLGDDHGRRLMFQVGVAGFAVTSVIAGLAPGPTMLIVARVLQGLSGGLINPQVSGLVQQMFRGPERGRAFGFLGTTVGLGTALGPLVGGALIVLGGPDLGWRLVFFINVPVGVVVIALARRFLPETPPTGRHRLDVVGSLVLGLATFCVLFGAVQTESAGPVVLWLGVPALGLLALFYRRERRLTERGARPAGGPAPVPPPVVHLRRGAGAALLPRDGRPAAGDGALLPARPGLLRARLGARGHGVRRRQRGRGPARGTRGRPARPRPGRRRCTDLRRRRRRPRARGAGPCRRRTRRSPWPGRCS